MRKTHALVQVAMALLEDPDGQRYGYELSKRAEVRSGVLYPILRRMELEGWLEDGWEQPTDARKSRPPRRYYRLTDTGKTELGAICNEARQDVRFKSLAWRPA